MPTVHLASEKSSRVILIPSEVFELSAEIDHWNIKLFECGHLCVTQLFVIILNICALYKRLNEVSVRFEETSRDGAKVMNRFDTDYQRS